MNTRFHKYHGAGNDFIIIDNRRADIVLSGEAIKKICHRRFGVGADGLMLVERSDSADFEMRYYNSDGLLGSFCGNGGRCIADYAHRVLKIVGASMYFNASDGIHFARIQEDKSVSLEMKDVHQIRFEADLIILDTGSPHYIQYVQDLSAYPVTTEGRIIRNKPEFQPRGINVNFLEVLDDELHIRTYERGVEAETFACGTGVAAAAIAHAARQTGQFSIAVITKAGHRFEVSFEKDTPDSAKEIILRGPVEFVFEGKI
jgi:diaminopimelate epimerase